MAEFEHYNAKEMLGKGELDNLQFIWELLLLNTGEDNDVYKALR